MIKVWSNITAYSLSSISKVTEAGKRVKFYSNDCQILDWDDIVVAVGVRRGNLYYLSCQLVKDDQVHVSNAQLNAKSKEFIWYQRFGCLNERSLHTLASQRLESDFPSGGRKQAEVPLGLVHSNVCGSLGAELLSGERYFLSFVDDKTHYTWVYVLKFSVNSWSGNLLWNECLTTD